MTIEEYRNWYIRFLITTIGPSVKREANNDQKLASDQLMLTDFENKKNGIMILLLVSILESNFLTREDLRNLRNFETSTTVLPISINQHHLSCFIYLRDCFAHNPSGIALNDGNNTRCFRLALESGTFNLATILDNHIKINPNAIHEMHLNILRLFEQEV